MFYIYEKKTFYIKKSIWSKDVILKEILSIQDRQHFGSAFVICSELDPEAHQLNVLFGPCARVVQQQNPFTRL